MSSGFFSFFYSRIKVRDIVWDVLIPVFLGGVLSLILMIFLPVSQANPFWCSVICQPVLEEFVFRLIIIGAFSHALLQVQCLRNKKAFVFGGTTLLSSLLFVGVHHPSTIEMSIFYFVSSFILSFFYLFPNESILRPILLHITWNLVHWLAASHFI